LADVNSNININFNTAQALAQLKALQAGLSKFHQSLAEGNLAAANAQKGLNAQLMQAVGATGKFAASQVKVASSTMAFTSALEKNKFSLREYYRYSMAAATANTRVLSRAFAQEREIINRARRDRVKALQAQYIQMAKSQGGFVEALRIMPKTLMMANGRFTELGTRIQYAAQRQQFLNQLLRQGSTQLLNFGKNTQWAGRQLMVGLTMPLALLGGYAAKAFRDLEKATVKFRRVYGDAFTNDAEVEQALSNIRMLAEEFTRYGVAVKDTVEMAATAAAAGFSGKALEEQVKTATKLAVLGQVEQQQALETTISLQNAFGLSTEQLASKINFLNAVENQTVLSIEDLTIAIPKAAPVVKQLGGTVEDLAFFLTAMKEGGINASQGANALKSGLASLINPTEKASKMLGEMGVNINGIVEANQGDIKGTVVGFARALDTLDPLNRARAIEQLFGKFQFARLSTLFQNVSKDGTQAARALDLAGSSVEELAVLSEREMKKVEDAVGTKFQAAVEQFKQDIMPLGKAFLEAITPIVKFFGKLFEKFNGLSDQTKKVIAIIVGVVAGLGPIVLMTFGLLANGLANLIKLFATIRGGIARLNGQTNVLGAGFNYVTQEQLEQQAAGQALHNTHTRLTQVFNVEKTAAMQLAAAYGAMSTQMRAMAAQNPALFAGGARGAAAAVSKLPKGPTGFEDGVVSVPGPKGAGDVVPALVSPGEAIIPAKTAEKHRGLITAMFQDKVPGFRVGLNPFKGSHSTKQSGAVDIGMPKRFADVTQSRMIAEKISQEANSGKWSKVKAKDFGQIMERFDGRSFPVRGVGGVYKQPNGQLVVVKPTMNESTAKADIRANELTRLHNANAPKSRIEKIIDPTDPERKRSYLALVSKYDPRFSPQQMTGKFSQSDMVKQLVASTIRVDRDLSRSNVSGRNIPDAGNAYIYDRASGLRVPNLNLPSMQEMAMINTLGVKGGAKKFFAQETSALAAKMTPTQYENAMKKEIARVLPLYKKTISESKNFQGLDPIEKQAYANVIKRLEGGLKADWKAVHAAHVRAGGNIPKYSTGLGGDAKQSAVEKHLGKFVIGDQTQKDKLVRKLRRDANIAFAKELNKLDPERRRVVEKAWFGGSAKMPDGTEKTFNKPRQSSFLRETQKMIPVKVGDEIRYVHPKDFDKFKADPEGRSQYARTKEQIIKNLLYRMGATERNGSFVAGGKFSGRFAALDHFVTDLRSTGKGAGGGKSILSGIVRPEAAKQEARYLARLGDPLKTRTGKTMLSLGYSAAEIKKKLKPELSHLDATSKLGIGGRDAIKFATGYAQYDSHLLNRFMTATTRHSNILDWEEKNKSIGLSAKEIKDYRRAAEFMSKNVHPATKAERLLVAKAAELDQRVIAHKNKGNSVPAKLLPADLKMPRAVSAVLKDTGIKPSAVMNLAATNSGAVLAKAGEYLVDRAKGTAKKLNVANTESRPMGAVPSTGKVGDNLKVTETPTKRVMTRTQVGRLAYSLPGRDAGDGTRITSPDQLSKTAQRRINAGLLAKERLLRKENKLTETQIQRAIQKIRTQRTEAEMAKANLRLQAQALKQAPQTAKEKARLEKQERRQLRQEKVSRFSGGASMALGTAGMGMMMSGNMGAGMGLMGASAIAGMAPMFAGMGPVGWITTATIAIGGSLFALNKHFENAAKKQAVFVDSISATTSKMDKIGQITDKVGASRAMEEVRSKGSFNDYNDVNRAGQLFGDTFLESEVGKAMAKGFVDNMALFGSKQAAQDFGLQLATYVSDGVLTSEQASSIAEQIGIQLGSRTYTTNIQAELRGLIGPNGQDILNQPLKTRMNIVAQTEKRSNILTNKLKVAQGQGLSGRTESAQLAAVSINNLQIAQAQADATEWQYKKQIQILQKQLAQTTVLEKQLEIKDKIAQLEKDMIIDIEKMNRLVGNQYKKELSNFEKNVQAGAWSLGEPREDAYFDSMKSMVKDRFKGTEFETMATDALSRNAKISDKRQYAKQGFKNQDQAQKLEVQLGFMMANGILNPQQNNALLELFAGNLDDLSSSLTLGVERHGAQKTVEMMDFFTGFENKEMASTMVTNIVNKDPKQFDKIGKTLAQLSVLDGHEVNMEAFLSMKDANGKPIGMELLEKLSNDLAKIEAMPDVTTKEAIFKYFEEGAGKGMSGMSKSGIENLISQWKNWDKLPDVAKKEAISKYKTIYETVFADEQARIDYAQRIAREKANAGSDGGRQTYLYEYIYKNTYETLMKGDASQQASNIAAAGSFTYVGEKGELLVKDPTGDPLGNDTGKKKDPYEEILKRLKAVRNAAINAAGGIKELNRALADSGSKSVKNRFIGIEQQLGAKGYSRQFSDWIMSMDAKEQANWMRTASKKVTKGKNKGRVINPFTGKLMGKNAKIGDVVLSQGEKTGNKKFDAVAMAKAFDAAIVGEFNSAAGKSLTILNEQEEVRRKLSALGYDATSIERILQDEYTTSAIANGKITQKELETNAALNNQVILRERINGLIAKGLQAQEQAANVKQIPQVLEFFRNMSKEGIGLSRGAMLDMIGDPDQLAAAISAMKDYESNAEGARDRLKEIVDGLNAIKANSNIKLIMDFVSKNPAEKAQAGFESAKRVMEVRKNIYSNMTIGELPGISTASRTGKDGKTIAGKNIGQQAVANVAARYKAAGVAVPQVAPGETLKGIQKKRIDLAKTMQIGQQALSAMQARYSAKQDELKSAQDNLEKALDDANDKYDKLVETQENIIKDLEDNIKLNYEDKITDLNKESDKLSNDLAIMDHTADKINEKYDKQVEALEKVSQINQDIAESQQQQLGLADALSQGDIAAAARAAQEMRASQQERMMNAQMSGIEQARQNELGALRGAETGMTREQISERQFQIQQAIYKLENDPERLKLEKAIEAAKTEITRLDKERTLEIEKINKNHDALITKLNSELTTINNELTAQKNILSTLEKQDTELASQETYLQSIVDEAVDLDDSTGMTLEKWEETVDKLIDIEQLAEDYAISLAAAEASAAATDLSWQNILNTINSIPESVTTNHIINEIRNITENITRYITTINLGGSDGSSGGNNTCPAGFVKNASGQCVPVTTSCPTGFVKNASGQCVPVNQSGEGNGNGNGNGNSGNTDLGGDGLLTAEAIAAAAKAKADAEEAAKIIAAGNAQASENSDCVTLSNGMVICASGGLIPSINYANGGFASYFNEGNLVNFKPYKTDTVPAMLTPGEFVMSKYAVQNYGVDKMRAINNGEAVGDSVYNYSISINVKSDANPDEIAQAVMTHIKQVDAKRLRGARL